MVHDLSSTGLLIETIADLSSAETLEVDIPEAGVTLATVVWSSGRFLGCKFKEPISLSAVSAASLRSEIVPVAEEEGAAPPIRWTPRFPSPADQGRPFRRLTLAGLQIFKAMVNRALGAVGLELVPLRRDQLLYRHDYGRGGYEAYRREQIKANRAKLDWVWADGQTLETIASDIERRGFKRGICHGARNGFEIRWFINRLDAQVVGTDISDTAAQFQNMVVHDFHEPKAEWIGRWDFIYTNSLDQAFDPEKALATWAEQLTEQGCIYIEHTMQHSAAGASATDPFGAHPMILPYLLFKWGRGKYVLLDILELNAGTKGNIWIFVVGRSQPNPRHAAKLA